jgi:hypothetical protein
MKIDIVCRKINQDANINSQVAKLYCSTMTMIAKDIDESNIKKLLNDYKVVSDYIENKTNKAHKPLAINTKKTYFINLKKVADIIKCNAAAIKFYEEKMMHYADISKKNEGDNIVPARFGDELPNWSELATLHKEFKGGAKFGVNHLIVGLYTLLPPRRGEYCNLIYLDKRPDIAPVVQPKKRRNKHRSIGNIPYNYIYPDGETYKMVLGSYKTDVSMGVYETNPPYDIPAELANIIKGYIKKVGVSNDEYFIRTTLVANTDGKYNAYKEPSFTSKITAAFKVKYEKHRIGVDSLRHIFITTGVDLAKLTTNERNALGNAMGHSLTQQDRYRQIQSSDENNEIEVEEQEPIEVEKEASCEECAHKVIDVEKPQEQPANKVITAQDLINKQYELASIQIEYFKTKLSKLKDT